MRRISVGLVVCAEDDVAAGHEALIAYLESHIFGDGLIGSIVTTAGITERVEARLEEMRRRFRRRRRGYRDTVWLAHPPPSKKKKEEGSFRKASFRKTRFSK